MASPHRLPAPPNDDVQGDIAGCATSGAAHPLSVSPLRDIDHTLLCVLGRLLILFWHSRTSMSQFVYRAAKGSHAAPALSSIPMKEVSQPTMGTSNSDRKSATAACFARRVTNNEVHFSFGRGFPKGAPVRHGGTPRTATDEHKHDSSAPLRACGKQARGGYAPRPLGALCGESQESNKSRRDQCEQTPLLNTTLSMRRDHHLPDQPIRLPPIVRPHHPHLRSRIDHDHLRPAKLRARRLHGYPLSATRQLRAHLVAQSGLDP